MRDLESLIKEVNKKFDEEIITVGLIEKNTGKIPFSSPRLNYMLYGGIPRGRIIEFAGDEGSGKTTTALDLTANSQRVFEQEHINTLQELDTQKSSNKQKQNEYNRIFARGEKRVLYMDCENTLNEDWAKLLGVNLDKLILIKPMSQTAEQLFQIILDFIETDAIGLVVIDSLGVMLSSQAYEKTMEEKTYGGIAMALTLFSKKAELLCNKHDCILVGINQMREDMNSQYGGLTTTGGKAWKHNCSLRLLFQKGSYVDDNGNELKRSAENPAGNLVMVSVTKTKVCRPDRRVGFYTLKYLEGIDYISDTIDVAIKQGVVIQAGSWFTVLDKATGEILRYDNMDLKIQGKNNLIALAKEHSEVLNIIQGMLND